MISLYLIYHSLIIENAFCRARRRRTKRRRTGRRASRATRRIRRRKEKHDKLKKDGKGDKKDKKDKKGKGADFDENMFSGSDAANEPGVGSDGLGLPRLLARR